ncbi:carboxypeptidase-like regulatory domain-containing protein [Saccharopolyspora hattusasensis]|uniref:carboxypeptidase-like regulatory domain-containing protein n=1 Tax=Saccharopolyspora hattusasensis TaxID=1128679 RepID=UPI003D95681F
MLCVVTAQRWRSDLRIVLNARDAASPAYTIAAFEVRDGIPGAQRIDAGDGLVGKVTDVSTGAALPNVEVAIIGADGNRVTASTTDPSGEYIVFVPPGTYTVAANGVGYNRASSVTTVESGKPTRVDLRLSRAVAHASTGRTVPGPQSQATTSDIVIGNDLMALAVSAGSNDGQLPGATVGKPLDLAAVGHLDQLDWLNLSYASTAQPRGANAWQQLTVKYTSVEVVATTDSSAVVRAAGASTDFPDVEVVTTYRIDNGQPWVAAGLLHPHPSIHDHQRSRGRRNSAHSN